MGCTSSGCMTNTQSEIEIKLKSGTLTQEVVSRKLEYKEPETFEHIKEQLNQVPRIASPISLKKRVADSEEAKIQTKEDQKEHYADVDGRDSYNKLGLELNLDDLQFRYGKTMEELEYEFDSVMQNFSNARKAFSVNQTSVGRNFNAEERIFALFSQWKMFVYDEICKKTGEIKNFISYGSGGRSFKILHEVNGWKDINLIKAFCEHAKLTIDMKFYNEMKSKIEAIGSLTVYVWVEVFDVFQDLSLSVGFNLTKPSDKRLVERFLSNSIERTNIMTWFDANTPVPIEYGFGVGEEINRNELVIGFYFFDGPLNANLGRSLTAFQAYGAELDKQMIEIFRALPGEEYKVYFVISPEGVQKVRMVISKIPETLENSILEQISKNNDLEAWRRLKKHFSPTPGRNSFFLEYSNEGFELYCVTEIGGEVTSRIYIEDH